MNLVLNCNFNPPLQNSGLLSKYTLVTFNILAFITIRVYLSSEKKYKKIEPGTSG